MYEIDPNRLDLAREFKANPFGRHSPELQLVLNRMRLERQKGRYVIVQTSDREFTLGQLSGQRGVPPTLLPEHVFSDPDDAEWIAFKLRWNKLTGRKLEIE